MPVAVKDEWAIVKKPGRYRPFIRTWGRVHVGVAAVTTQDQPKWPLLVVSTDEQLYAMSVSEMLNREIDHGGHWMVGWCHPAPITKVPLEMVCRWLDVDKDVQLRVWIEGPLQAIAAMPLEDIVGSCENAWANWHEVDKHWLAVHPGQKVKAQKGERIDFPDFGPDVFGA